jgi:carboxynorspermidine decarboxylase
MHLDTTSIPSPAFVLDRERFQENLNCLEAFQRSAGVDLMLALKAFAMHHVFPMVRQVTSSAAASSLNEVLLAAEFFEHVHTYMPAYSDASFDAIAKRSRAVTFNSVAQFETYRARLQGARAGLRVNPGYSDVSTELYNPCRVGSRLGIPVKRLVEEGLPAGVSGLHVHNLCESGADALAQTLTVLETQCGELLDDIEWLNLGGGHLITRQDYDTELAASSLRAFQERHPRLELMLEPGAAFAWRAGVLVATVLDIVETDALPVAMLDISFSAHLPDCLEMPYTPEVRGGTIDGTGAYTYCVGGASCLAGDVVGTYSFDEALIIGQRLIFEDMMHYTMVKTNTFNGVGLPCIGEWHAGQFKLVKSFGYDDFRSRLS